MIFFIYQLLADAWGFTLPTAFTYSSTRMMLAALTSLVVTILMGPWFIRKLYELKTGQSIRVEDCPMLVKLHEKKKETPTMGGILILFAMLVSLVLWMDWKSSFTLLFLITTLWLGMVGGYDDYLKLKFKNSKGLSAKKKFLFQNLCALFVSLYLFFPEVSDLFSLGSWFNLPNIEVVQNAGGGIDSPVTALPLKQYMSVYFLPFLKDPIWVLTGVGVLFGVLFSVVVITGTSNAVNLTDGLDGLASGCLVMVAGVLAVIAFLSNNFEIARYLNILYIEGGSEIAVYLSALVGACLGFLWYNGYPAQVFMGDIGSIALGGILGVAAVCLRREFLLALLGGVFVAETLSVIIQVISYKLRRKRVFLCSPLHHHFEYKGWPETKVVVRFWIVSLILALIGLASLKLQ